MKVVLAAVLFILILILILFLLYVLFLFVCSRLVDPNRTYMQDSRFYRGLLNGATVMLLKAARVRVRVTGMETVPENKCVLFVGNHRSKFDPIITWYIFRKWHPAFISKEENFHVPVFGRIIRKCCFMAIDRENPREALKTVNQAAALIQQKAVSVGVYPEGTRSRSGELLPFHNGVLKIAQKSQTDIVVLAIDGSELIAKRFPLHGTTVCLDVVGVIPAQEVCAGRTGTLGEKVRNLLAPKLEERKKERSSL